MPQLFEPVTLGALTLPNRIVMAPLTRLRAVDGRLPNALMLEYYRQRAGAGLILTEATAISPMGVGYPDTPGIWSERQVEGWRAITAAVHQAGGRIMMQLWHVGRISHSHYLDGQQPVAPSAIAAEGQVSLLRPKRAYETPRALETEELAGIVADYRRAAARAKTAGFDGVEIHAANGYLLDQFLHDGSNHRDDRYGGSIAHRSRLLLEVVDAILEVWPADRVGVHLNLMSNTHSMHDSDPAALFGHVAAALGERRLAFIFAREELSGHTLAPLVKQRFGGPLIANDGLDLASAERLIASGAADAVAFGRLYIANPDLVERLRDKAALNPLRTDTIYQSGAEGYTDYPALA